MSATLFNKAEQAIDNGETIAWSIASLYGKSLYEVQFMHWFVLRVANALLNARR